MRATRRRPRWCLHLPSGGSPRPPPQSSLWFCAWCSLEEGSWITLRILLKSYLGLCLNRKEGRGGGIPPGPEDPSGCIHIISSLNRKKWGKLLIARSTFGWRGSAQE